MELSPSFECSVKTKGLNCASWVCRCWCVSDRSPGWEINHPCRIPSPDSSVLRSNEAPRRDHTHPIWPRAGGLQRRGPSLPPARRVTMGCGYCAPVASGQPAGPSSYLNTKSLRCIAFFGVKPSPGQSEISAFFRSIATQKV